MSIFTDLAETFSEQTAIESLPVIGFEMNSLDSPFLIMKLAIAGGGVGCYVDRPTVDGYRVGMTALSGRGAKWLHEVFVTSTHLEWTSEGREIQTTARDIAEGELEHAIHTAITTAYTIRFREESGQFGSGTIAPMFWSAGLLNMGDWIGPILVRKMTGRIPVPFDRAGIGPRSLYTIGSILGWINRSNIDVWGSGLIEPLNPKQIADKSKLKGVAIHAVRGKLTRDNVADSLSWEVPPIFGDPALLLPRYIKGHDKDSGPAFVAHHRHRTAIAKLPGVRMVDVRADVKDVAREISRSSVVFSTALHGIILAQAYEVPWVWIKLEDSPLWGGDFKFMDFFSTLRAETFPSVRTTLDGLSKLDIQDLTRLADLPSLDVDLDKLHDSIPLEPIKTPNNTPNIKRQSTHWFRH